MNTRWGWVGLRFGLRLVLALGLGGLAPALAWGPRGHATTGAIAEQLIAGTRAQAEVAGLLRGLGVTLMQATAWADCVKAVQPAGGHFAYLDPGRYADCKAFETPEGMARAAAYVQANWRGCRPGPGQDPCHKQYHYTDVSLQHRRYGRSWVGTSDHDLVAALQACVAVLQGRSAPLPFRFHDRTEALLLLVHLVGDVHQPLHVGAVYLDAQGRRVDPDAGRHDPHTDTVGGNRLLAGHEPMHRRWDDVPARLGPQVLGGAGLDAARAVPASAGPPSAWPALWATETLAASRAAYQGVVFGAAVGQPPHWPVTLPEDYDQRREAIQQAQLTRAGARLAQLLRALFPG